MPLACVVGNTDTGHGSFPPTAVTAGSPDVNFEGSPVARQGDPLGAHGSPSPSPPHGRSIASGSGSVNINGIPCARIGDSIGCGGALVASNGTVHAA